MNRRTLGVLALVCLFFTVLWLVFLIASQAMAGTLATFEQVLTDTARLDGLFYLILVAPFIIFAGFNFHERWLFQAT